MFACHGILWMEFLCDDVIVFNMIVKRPTLIGREFQGQRLNEDEGHAHDAIGKKSVGDNLNYMKYVSNFALFY